MNAAPQGLGRRLAGWLIMALRLVSYGGLAFLVSGFVLLVGLPLMGVCETAGPRLGCTGAAFQSLADYAVTVMLVSAFTGLPVILALSGIVFLLIDTSSWWQGRRR